MQDKNGTKMEREREREREKMVLGFQIPSLYSEGLIAFC
jgi:hypothetical protein